MKKNITSISPVCPVDQPVHEEKRLKNDKHRTLKHTYNDYGIFMAMCLISMNMLINYHYNGESK